MKRALVPGTFDPITVGHVDVITRASMIFDEVVVGVVEESHKANTRPALFECEERIAFVEQATSGLSNTSVRSFSNLLVEFAQEINAHVIIKGLRVVTDFELEFQMAALNWKLDPQIETMFIMSSPDNMYLSSSAVKEIALHGGCVEGLVPDNVAKALDAKIAALP